MDIHNSVLTRYSEGAKAKQASLCCPIDYDRGLLEMLPQEIIEKDYGCGDPSSYVQAGDVVLDLGSGGGKICYMAAQLVGEQGQVIGVDMNDDMLALARKFQTEMAEKLGSDRVRFVKGYIQDLALDVDAMEKHLAERPVKTASDYSALQDWQSKQRREQPMIADNSVDLVISNCVLNLVDDAQKQQLVQEIFRVLKPGGRVAISDIVSDQPVPESMKQDHELWSGCISGAFHEQEFLQVFADAGFHGAAYDKWDEQPWQVVNGIIFRSVTLMAIKAPVSSDQNEYTIFYRGPYAAVMDEAGSVYRRGQYYKVDAQTWGILASGLYRDAFITLRPVQESDSIQSTSCCSSSSCG